VTPRLSAWRFVVGLGVVSLLADVVYEGARSVSGPLLESLGAGALVVGAVTGAGEAAALILRLFSGVMTDRTRRFWAWTIAGYVITIVAVPFMGLAGVLWVVCALIIVERVGKAVRGPAKTTLLSHATAVTGRGRGFAVHEAMDQTGALLGPLVVGGMLVLTGDDFGPALAVLAVPGVAVIGLLVWLRLRVPEPAAYEGDGPEEPEPTTSRVRWYGVVPRAFWVYAGFAATTTLGLTTFGLASFHMVDRGYVAVAAVPVVYAVAMAVDALAALATGWGYDRRGPQVLVVLPVLASVATALVFGGSTAAVVAGAVVWGAAIGIHESTMKAVVADLVPPKRRATAYGMFAAIVGGATALGGALLGFLYQVSTGWLVVVAVAIQVLAGAVLVVIVRKFGGRSGAPGGVNRPSE